MSVAASRHNRATPESSYADLASSVEAVYTAKPFTLHFNTLDGSHHPVAAPQGWWDNVLSDDDGYLPSAAVLTCTDADVLHTIHVSGYAPEGVYPVDFIVTFYDESGAEVYKKEVVGNTNLDYSFHLPAAYNYASYTVSISRINKANSVAKVSSIFNRHEIVRSEDVAIKSSTLHAIHSLFKTEDTLVASVKPLRDLSVINYSSDTFINTSEQSLINAMHFISDNVCVDSRSVTAMTSSMTVQDNIDTSLQSTSHGIFTTSSKDTNKASVKPLRDLSVINYSSDTFINTSEQSLIDATNFVSDNVCVDSHSATAMINSMTVQDSIDASLQSASHGIFTTSSKDTNKVKSSSLSTGTFTNHVDDALAPVSQENSDGLMNVHLAMTKLNRHIYGKVRITYNNPFSYHDIEVSAQTAYARSTEMLSNGETDDGIRYFSMFDNRLDGSMPLQTSTSKPAWHGTVFSDKDGYFSEAQVIELSFEPTFLDSLSIYGDSAYNNYPVDFTVDLLSRGDAVKSYSIVDNTDLNYNIFSGPISSIDGLRISVTRISVGNMPLAISEIPIFSSVTYEQSDLMSIDLFEELSYNDESLSLGGVSANELTVYLNNTNNAFFFNRDPSFFSERLKKNRKVEAWLGTYIYDKLEWYKLGTFWSYEWEVPTDDVKVKVVAFDTIGLLNTMTFYNHRVLYNKTLYDLFDYVLNDAKNTLPFLEYCIDERLKDIEIPVAWFNYASYMQALERLAQSAYVNVYCDREGVIQVRVQDYDIDTWHMSMSKSTNVKSLSYPTRYSVQPNVISVGINKIVSTENTTLLNDKSIIQIDGSEEVTYVFNGVATNVSSVDITMTDGLEYSYTWYSWGLVVSFTGSGTVTGCTVQGDSIAAQQISTLSIKDAVSIKANGEQRLTISSDLIQTQDRAAALANKAKEDVSRNIYNAEVEYNGDISLSLNDHVWLKDGIAPHNFYQVKRHELNWNGGLTGSVVINT